MKCSEPFILEYNHLFCFLEKSGYEELEKFWSLLQKTILGRLKYMAKTEGHVGMLKYWSETLSAEGADFDITLSTNTQTNPKLTMHIRTCPSLSKIKENKQEPCAAYCDHCKSMYSEALEALGYKFTVIATETGCMIGVD